MSLGPLTPEIVDRIRARLRAWHDAQSAWRRCHGFWSALDAWLTLLDEERPETRPDWHAWVSRCPAHIPERDRILDYLTGLEDALDWLDRHCEWLAERDSEPGEFQA